MTIQKSTNNLETDVRTLVAEILETDPDQISAEAHFVKDLGMDSMMALEILASIEKKYKIIIPEEMLPKFINLDKTVSIVRDILVNKK